MAESGEEGRPLEAFVASGFERMETCLEALLAAQATTNVRLGAIEGRFDRFEQRFDRFELRLDAIQEIREER